MRPCQKHTHTHRNKGKPSQSSAFPRCVSFSAGCEASSQGLSNQTVNTKPPPIPPTPGLPHSPPPPAVSTARGGTFGMLGVEKIAAATDCLSTTRSGRSHGDANCEGLLVLRRRDAGSLRDSRRNQQHVRPPASLPSLQPCRRCNSWVFPVKISGLFVFFCFFLIKHPQCVCFDLVSWEKCPRGDGRAPRDPSELLRVIIW